MTDPGAVVTERLALEPITADLADAIVAGLADERWAPGFPQEGDLDCARMVVNNPPVEPDALRWGPRLIIDRESGAWIGSIGYYGPPDERGWLRIGYGVVPAFQGAGRATEALAGLLTLAHADESVHRVRGDALRGNIASHRVMTNNGFEMVEFDATSCEFELVLRPDPELG